MASNIGDVNKIPAYPKASSINQGKKLIRDVKINKFSNNVPINNTFSMVYFVFCFNLIPPDNVPFNKIIFHFGSFSVILH